MVNRVPYTDSCLLTVITVAELEEYQAELAELARAGRADQCFIFLLDSIGDCSLSSCEGWHCLSQEDIRIDDYLNKAMIFTQEELSEVCRIHALALLSISFEKVFSVQPAAYLGFIRLGSLEIVEDSLLLTGSLENNIEVILEESINQTYPLIAFLATEKTRAFLEWCVEKVDYELRFFANFGVMPRDLDLIAKHWIFFLAWPQFAQFHNIGLTPIDIDLYCGTNNRLSLEYRFSRLADGTPISPLLRENYRYNYLLREKSCESPFQACSTLLDETTVLSDSFPIALTPVMQELYAKRADLRVHFPDLSQMQYRLYYCEWFLSEGRLDSDLKTLDPRYFRSIQNAWQLHENTLRRDLKKATQKGPLKARFRQSKASHTLKELSGRTPDLLDGINLCGYIYGRFGLGVAIRNMAETLHSAEIPFTVTDYRASSHRFIERTWQSKVSNSFPFTTNLICINADCLPWFVGQCDPNVFEARYNIGYWFWELNKFPEEWLSALDLLDELWVASNFMKTVFGQYTEIPITVIPQVVLAAPDLSLSRKDFGLAEDAFTVLTSYDSMSTPERKNPEAAIAAFLESFRLDKEAQLIIKVNGPLGGEINNKVVRFAEDNENITLITSSLSKSSHDSLINCADAIISLHRSEGFGLVPAEGMYLGKPAVLTNWSGNTDYMTDDNCCAVDYELIEITEEIPPYPKGGTWAEPDAHQAASYLRRLFEDREYYQNISVAARETIHNKFSTQAVAEVLLKHLKELGQIM